MATDVFDKELKAYRDQRWDKAFPKDEDSASIGSNRTNTSLAGFSVGGGSTVATTTNVDREGDLRATIVIEHLIQASDVSHTMQHWHIYRKWQVSRSALALHVENR